MRRDQARPGKTVSHQRRGCRHYDHATVNCYLRGSNVLVDRALTDAGLCRCYGCCGAGGDDVRVRPATSLPGVEMVATVAHIDIAAR